MKELSSLERIKAVGQLVRVPNLLIIILTQLLLRYSFILPYLYPGAPELASSMIDFTILITVTLLLAAGGYIINDYFDVKIDRINRPQNLVVGRLITVHTAIKLHIILNTIAILLGFYLAWRIRSLSFGMIFPLISGLLWIYSAKYKRFLFWGNFIVSGLSAFVILVVWLFEFFWLRLDAFQFMTVLPDIRWVARIFLGYALFAFLVSMVREIVKDMEDTEGDAAAGCQTLPLAFGTRTARFIAAATMGATILLLAYTQFVLYRLEMTMPAWYFMVTVQPGALYFLFLLFRAKTRQDYHFLSTLCKLIMVAGILSMEVLFISK